jgi:gamma-syntrophin
VYFLLPFSPLATTTVARDTPESDNDATCAELKTEIFNNNGNVAMNSNGSGGSNSNSMNNNSNHRPNSLCSEPEIRWVDIVSVPLMMAYVTRYIYGTDKLRTNAFEVRGLNGTTTGVIHLDDLAILSSWLKYITDNIIGLTNLQVNPLRIKFIHFFFVNSSQVPNPT